MKLKNIILVIVFTLFTIQPTKVESSDIVSDILGTALEQGKKYKQEREKWGIPKNDLAGLKSKEIKSLLSGNIVFGEWKDDYWIGKTESTYYDDGSYEAVFTGKLTDGKKANMKEKGTWSAKQGKVCFKGVQTYNNEEREYSGCSKVLKSKTNPNDYFLRNQGVIYLKFVKIISVKDKIEEERIAKEKKEEKERAEKEKRIAEEEKRIAEEEKKQQEEEEILQKKLKLFTQRSELENAQHFLNHIGIYINKYPEEFDIVKISEFLILTKPISNNIFEEKQKNDLALFKDFAMNSSAFRDYFNDINQEEIDNQLAELDNLYSELEFFKKELEIKFASNPDLTQAVQHIKDIDIMLQNPESINQLEEYKVRVNQYITGLDQEEAKLNSELVKARNNVYDLKAKLKEDLTSDLAPLIIQQVKLLEEAVEKKIFKDLVSANEVAKDFIYKNWLEAEEKQAEEERKKAEEERKKAEEERKKREEEEKRIAEEEKKDEEKRRAQRTDLFCTYVTSTGMQNYTWSYDGKYFYMDGIKLSIGAEVSDPMGAVFTVYKKGRNKFFVDFDQYMGDDRSVAMMEMDIYVDFNKNSSYLEIRTLATAPLDVTGMCVQKN